MTDQYMQFATVSRKLCTHLDKFVMDSQAGTPSRGALFVVSQFLHTSLIM